MVVAPQAIIWIVTRSESQLLRADGVWTMTGVRRMKGIRAASSLDKPPVSLTASPNELLLALARPTYCALWLQMGQEPSRSIGRQSDLHFRDYSGEARLGDETLYFNTHPFWSNLSVRADDCKRCWPMPAAGKEPGSRSFVAAHRPSGGEVLAFIEEKRQVLRAERKRAGRDVLLGAAMIHFGLSRTIALDIWNSAARDHKCGRPKNAKPGTARSIATRLK